MALKQTTRIERKMYVHKVTGQEVFGDVEVREVVHELKCKTCGKVCGTITFPEDHGRPSHDALEAELKAAHETVCDEHKN